MHKVGAKGVCRAERSALAQDRSPRAKQRRKVRAVSLWPVLKADGKYGFTVRLAKGAAGRDARRQQAHDDCPPRMV